MPMHDDATPITHHAPVVDAHDQVHIDWKTYRWVALILFVITVGEVWAYYVPGFSSTRWFVPMIIFLGTIKFAIVVMFYMHLKYDSKLFRALFVGPLTIAICILIALMFLFAKMSIRLG
jgi:cytochrome c oxidase subunit 4